MSRFSGAYSDRTQEALKRKEQDEQQRATEWAVLRDLAKALDIELAEQRSPMSGSTVNRVRAVLKEEQQRQERMAELAKQAPPARTALSAATRYF